MIRLAQKKNVNDLIFIPIFILINDWWYPSSYSLNFAMLGAFLLYTLIFDRKNALNYEATILMIVALTYIDFYAKSALAVALYLAMRFRPQIWDKRAIAACFALAVALLGFSGGLNQILFQLKFYVFRGVSESSEPVFKFEEFHGHGIVTAIDPGTSYDIIYGAKATPYYCIILYFRKNHQYI